MEALVKAEHCCSTSRRAGCRAGDFRLTLVRRAARPDDGQVRVLRWPGRQGVYLNIEVEFDGPALCLAEDAHTLQPRGLGCPLVLVPRSGQHPITHPEAGFVHNVLRWADSVCSRVRLPGLRNEAMLFDACVSVCVECLTLGPRRCDKRPANTASELYDLVIQQFGSLS